MKIRPVGAQLFRLDGQTDSYDDVNSTFRNLAEARNNLRSAHTVYLCAVYVCQNNQQLFPCTRLVFVIQADCV